MNMIQNYRQIGCGCCTGRSVMVENDWGDGGQHEERTDQCVCRLHSDLPLGVRMQRCSVHEPRPGVIVTNPF